MSIRTGPHSPSYSSQSERYFKVLLFNPPVNSNNFNLFHSEDSASDRDIGSSKRVVIPEDRKRKSRRKRDSGEEPAEKRSKKGSANQQQNITTRTGKH